MRNTYKIYSLVLLFCCEFLIFLRRIGVIRLNGGAERNRTADPLLAKQMLYQLSYSPIVWEKLMKEQKYFYEILGQLATQNFYPPLKV